MRILFYDDDSITAYIINEKMMIDMRYGKNK